MSWAKFDDRYDDNRKVKKAWRKNKAAIGLHAMAITYCSRHHTDGIVDVEWLIEKVPADRERQRILLALAESGLFERLDADHWRVHDYLDYNPSGADAARIANEKAEAGRRGGLEKARRRGTRLAGASEGAKHLPASSASTPASPVPSPPDPKEPDPQVAQRSVEHPPDTAEGVAGEVIEVLRKQPRFGPISAATYEVGIQALHDAHPDKPILVAAHEAVALAADPAWRMTNPLGCLRFCLSRIDPAAKPVGTTGQNVTQLKSRCRKCDGAVRPGYGAYCETCSEELAG